MSNRAPGTAEHPLRLWKGHCFIDQKLVSRVTGSAEARPLRSPALGPREPGSPHPTSARLHGGLRAPASELYTCSQGGSTAKAPVSLPVLRPDTAPAVPQHSGPVGRRRRLVTNSRPWAPSHPPRPPPRAPQRRLLGSTFAK